MYPFPFKVLAPPKHLQEGDLTPTTCIRNQVGLIFPTSNTTHPPKPDDIINCMKPLLMFARVFGVVPITGIFSGNVHSIYQVVHKGLYTVGPIFDFKKNVTMFFSKRSLPPLPKFFRACVRTSLRICLINYQWYVFVNVMLKFISSKTSTICEMMNRKKQWKI